MKAYSFKKAVPVWEKGKDREKNYNLVFKTVIPKSEGVIIALSASNSYQMFINGNMVSQGPARAGHGLYRVDEIDVSKHLTNAENVVTFYVNSYYVKSYYLICQPGFFCAEVIADGKVIAATGHQGFVAKYHADRIRKIVRYSAQRTFAEAYRYNNTYKAFDTLVNDDFSKVELCETSPKKFIERKVPYPSYREFFAQKIISRGTSEFFDEPINPNRYEYVDIGDNHERGFNVGEAEIINSDEVHKGVYTITSAKEESFASTTLDANAFVTCAYESEKTGFIKASVKANCDCELICCFDETLVDGDLNFQRSSSVQNTVVWFLKAGEYSLITNEPYSLKYIRFINKSSGNVEIKNVSITEYAFDIDVPKLNSGNPNLDKIYDAAVETFRQNTVDIYMDCPSRERAGWLCDSFFTARVEKELTGKSVVEENFLENFLIAEGFNDIDSRMLAMCYPADSRTGNFIPNWAMWYVLELEEYLERTGDREFIDTAKERIYNLHNYFEGFENSDGLLEKLDKWVFVEWSMANDFVQDVSYPSNMLYARMLRAMGKLYDEKFISKAEKIEKAIIDQSYFDGFFHDHAIRNEDGTLQVVKEDITETCQYYAFYMGVATKEAFPVLWKTLLNDFGANRVEKGLWKDIHPANAFIGYYLRLDLLANENEKEIVLKDIEDFFLSMAEKTGTLWEHNKPMASCNHGFASHVIIWLNKFIKNQ